MSDNSIPRKTCTNCGESKLATTDNFNKAKRGIFGLTGCCKTCRSEKQRIANAANPEKNRERAREWARKNPERNRAKAAAWAKENPERMLEHSRAYYRKHRERANAATRRWRLAHPEQSMNHVYRRLARKNQVPQTLTTKQWEACLSYFNGCCTYCGAQQSFWHVIEKEHYIPLTKSGGYTADNIIPACRECNSSKGNRDAADWLPWKFGKHKARKITERIEVYFQLVRAQES